MSRLTLRYAVATAAFLGLWGAESYAQQNPLPQQPITAATPDPRNEDYVLFGKKAPKKSTEREVLGQVIDSSSNPVSGAVVSLTRVSDQKARKLISDKGGNFLFDGLSKTDDYVLTASIKGQKPVERRISQYDARRRIQLMLQFEPADPSATPTAAAEKPAAPADNAPAAADSKEPK
jgi:hypothetical protein